MLLFCVSCPSYECSHPSMYLGTSFCCRDAFRFGKKKTMCCWGPKITSDPALVWIKLLEVNRSSVSVMTSESDYKVVEPPTTPLHLPAALLNRRSKGRHDQMSTDHSDDWKLAKSQDCIGFQLSVLRSKKDSFCIW